jgi:membrane protein implicated in regulation of membrane protease activity
MEHAYIILFLVGVIYTVITFLLGGFFDIIHLGGDITAHIDGGLGGHGANVGGGISPLKPITIVSFLTVFGGIGIIGTNHGINPIITFIVAFVAGFIISFSIFTFIIVPLSKAQNTSAVYQDKLIGMEAVVISRIMENGFGTIGYVVNGSKYNAPAQHVSKKAVEQGEKVLIYLIKDKIFYVEPLDN